MFADERPEGVRGDGLSRPVWAVLLALLLGIAATSRSCEDTERVEALATEQRRITAQTLELTNLAGDPRRWERWSEEQVEMLRLKEKYEARYRERMAARGVEISPGRFISGSVAELSARRVAALEDLAEFDAREKSGAHGRPGVVPPMLEVVHEESTTKVRNLTDRELSVSVSRHHAEEGLGASCALFVSATREGAYGLMPIRPGKTLLYVVNSRSCPHGAVMLSGFEVRDASGLIWASDPVLEKLRGEKRAWIADLDLALAASK
jgi:hypothetical protein